MHTRLAIMVFLLIVYVSSWFLPIYYGKGNFVEDGMELYGLYGLIFGWRDMNLENLAWLANPLLLIAIPFYLRENYLFACCISALAAGAALSLLAALVPADFRLSYPIAIIISERAELRIGYLIWTATPFLLFLISLISLCVRAFHHIEKSRSTARIDSRSER